MPTMVTRDRAAAIGAITENGRGFLRMAARPRYNIGMETAYFVAGIVSVIGILVWIGLLLWAAREDGRDQRRRDQR